MSSITIIKAEIKAILDGLIATTDLQAVYDESPTILADTPACTIIRGGGGRLEYQSTADMKLSLNYTIRVFLEKTENDDTQVAIFDTLLDNIIDALSKRVNHMTNTQCQLEITDISELYGAKIGNSAIMYTDITLATFTFKPLN